MLTIIYKNLMIYRQNKERQGKGNTLKCDRCPVDKHVKKITGFGNLCYKCFGEMVERMLEFDDDWLLSTIIPAIKIEISDGIMREGDDFDMVDYIDKNIYGEEVVDSAINSMMDGGSLPEVVRKFLNTWFLISIDEVFYGDEDG